MIAETIAQELSVPEKGVAAALTLLGEGNTVPFIARYRKEATGGLDDTQLRAIEERATYLTELQERKETVLAAIEEQGKLDDELRQRIDAADTKARLEDIYRPYKKRRKTKADKAREAGLAPLVDALVDNPAAAPEELAVGYLSEGYPDAKAALKGARAIFVDDLAMDADLVEDLREKFYSEGHMVARVAEGKEAEGGKYRDYFDFSEPFSSLPSHRILALLRGESEGVLQLDLDPGEDADFERHIATHCGLADRSAWVDKAIHWGWRTKLSLSCGLDVRMRLKETAEDGALKIFAKNLRDVLLAAPAGQRATLGLDPGYRNGVKCAVVDNTGKVLDTVVVYPHQPQNKWDAARDALAHLSAQHGVELIAVGNGTASRETDKLAHEVADLIATAGGTRPTPVTVSEAGASVYSASQLAADEFPDMDVSLRGAVSIARRLQDPLAELVKIDPKSIGVGQYQHDVNQTHLARTLDAVVEDAVNGVGVDLNTASEGGKYRDYFDFSEPFSSLPSHRILALLRGESEGVLQLDLDPGEDADFERHIATHCGLADRSAWVDKAIHWGWRTKLSLSCGLDVRMRLKETAEDGALKIFAKNLRDVLLAAPAGQRATLGLDPGYRNGVKCAVVDNTGKVLDTVVVYPHQPQNKWDAARDALAHLSAQHGVELIAVGNGTASRETDKLAHEVADLIATAGGTRPTPVTVSEAGASVYSASQLAADEFPDMDVSLRGAVSIARRLQDPLAELVKIDPKSIGVGQYQHDVNQTHLARTLDAVVEDAVNGVGVDLNTASVPLLERVAGVSPTLAENIVRYRNEHGSFATRKELAKVPRLGPKAFEQSAGFLRITGGDDPLDASAVHPEAYSVVTAMSQTTGLGVAELIGNSRVLHTLNPADYATAEFGVPTVTDILAELDKPGRDPRPQFKTAAFKEGVSKVSDVKPGMVLEGTVTNVAAFGAFVDVGVHQDGLVHVSAMSHDFVADPHDVIRSGEVVKVKVLDVDVDRQRISLSLRLDDEPGAASEKGSGKGTGKGAGKGAKNRGRGKGQGGKRGGNRSGNRAGGRGGNRSQNAGGAMADALKKAGFGQ